MPLYLQAWCRFTSAHFNQALHAGHKLFRPLYFIRFTLDCRKTLKSARDMKIHQNFVVLAAALGFAVLILLANMYVQSADGMLRMGFAAVLLLLGRDTLASTHIALEQRGRKLADRWIFAFYFSLYMGTFMLLALWRGMGYLPSLLMGVTIGVLFGGLLRFVLAASPYKYPHHFELESPRLSGRAGQWLYYTMPLLKLALIWALVRISPPTPNYLFFYILLIGFALPRYRRKSGGNRLWANFPTLTGYVLLVTLLFAPF